MSATQGREIARLEAAVPAHYFVFDLPYVDGFDLRGAVERRKEALRKALAPSPRVHFVEHFDDGIATYEAALKNGLEGVMAKRRDSRYEAGKRSANWVKVKKRPTE